MTTIEQQLIDFIRELSSEAQSQIDAMKPGLPRSQCKDDYEHGWRNGAFYILVELRRSIKDHRPEIKL